MADEHDTPPASAGQEIVGAQHLEEHPKGTKRQHTHVETSEDATGSATPESPPNKRRRKDSVSAAEDAAVKEAEIHEEKAKEAEKVRDAAELKRKEEEKVAKEKAKEAKKVRDAAVKKRKEEEKAVKKKAKEAKKARDAAEKKRKAVEKAAIKAAKDQEREETKKSEDEAKKKSEEEKAQKKRRTKQWEDYCTHNTHGATLAEEPKPSITQTDACQLYTLKPNELACLPHHPKVNPMYRNTTKLFDEDEVRPLAFRKYAVLAGVEGPESTLITQGKKLWEDEGERLGKEKLARVVAWRGGLVRDVDHGCDGNGDVNWWRDPRELRRQGYENGKLPTGPGGFHPSQ